MKDEEKIGNAPESHVKRFVEDAERILQYMKYHENLPRTNKVTDWGLTLEQEKIYKDLRKSEKKHPLHEVMCKMLTEKYNE